jgi:hypothetical protein
LTEFTKVVNLSSLIVKKTRMANGINGAPGNGHDEEWSEENVEAFQSSRKDQFLEIFSLDASNVLRLDQDLLEDFWPGEASFFNELFQKDYNYCCELHQKIAISDIEATEAFFRAIPFLLVLDKEKSVSAETKKEFFNLYAGIVLVVSKQALAAVAYIYLLDFAKLRTYLENMNTFSRATLAARWLTMFDKRGILLDEILTYAKGNETPGFSSAFEDSYKWQTNPPQPSPQ